MVRFFRKYHKWIGLIFSFFLLMFAISGIILNHRHFLSTVDVPRSILPKSYHYKNWNNGSVKSTLALDENNILLYGNSGIWRTNREADTYTPLMNGMKKGIDNRTVSSIVQTPNHNLFAATTYDLYRMGANDQWESLTTLAGISERLTDMTMRGDTLVVVGRSYLYSAVPPYNSFTKLELAAPKGYKKEATLFRTMWLLHSGEMFGITGQLFVDLLGILLIIVTITGLIFTLSPGIIKRRRKKKKSTKRATKTMSSSIKWHNKLGAWFLAFFLILCITGMFLRPPLLIAIIRSSVKPILGSILDSSNAWHEKLRCMRYDQENDEWLLYSSSGFFTLSGLKSVPEKIDRVPPVSVMGVNVLEPSHEGWLVGSFNGLHIWDRKNNKITDGFTGKEIKGRPKGRPVSAHPVSGLSTDFKQGMVVYEYGTGATILGSSTPFVPMPPEIQKGRMSLWHLGLEVHVGRAYQPLIGPFSDLFVFLAGLFLSFILISGYVVYYKCYRRKRTKKH